MQKKKNTFYKIASYFNQTFCVSIPVTVALLALIQIKLMAIHKFNTINVIYRIYCFNFETCLYRHFKSA